MKHLSGRFAALALITLTGCAGVTNQTFGDTFSNITYVLSASESSAPELRCPPYELPVQPAVPSVPLQAYSALESNDTKLYNTLTLTYIEGLRRYISESRRRNTNSVLVYNLQCN
jgi:hypothetical protein